MKWILSLYLLLFSSIAFAQDNNERPTRDSFTLIMPVTKETYYHLPIQFSPFVVGPKILQLFPGETVLIEVELVNGTVADIKCVKENKNPNKTLEISFAQNVTDQVHSSMMLKVKNPFKQDLSYAATIRLMDSGKWVKTSIIPVSAGLTGFEMWPDLIISIALSEWKLL